MKFLSTPPSRVATPASAPQRASLNGFYPRHPRGWRHATPCLSTVFKVFLSTPPSRVATRGGQARCVLTHMFLSTPPSRVATAHVAHSAHALHVSIHATLAGGDATKTFCKEDTMKFLSTPPSRVATGRPYPRPGRTDRFYPRHPRGWRLPGFRDSKWSLEVSIHATLAGGDGLAGRSVGRSDRVSIHATLAGGDG